MKKPIIEFKNVSKVFEDNNTVVLKDINFELEEGKFYTLLGSSGSGKSTILNIIAGLLDATDGDIFLDGVRINDIPTRVVLLLIWAMKLIRKYLLKLYAN